MHARVMKLDRKIFNIDHVNKIWIISHLLIHEGEFQYHELPILNYER